jgi:alpha-galactosidase
VIYSRSCRLLCIVLAFAAAGCLSSACGQSIKEGHLAPRPPMGWNSWDSYGLTIDEAQFQDNVDILSKTLQPFGWNYAVIDEGWFLKNPTMISSPEKLIYEIDPYGRYIPVPERFPSASNGTANIGFKKMSDHVHSLGLKFGIHIVRGIPRESVARNLPISGSHYTAQDAADKEDPCPWDPTNWGVKDTAAGQAWYDGLLKQYAAWGVDYIKVDCVSDHPYRAHEIRMIHKAIVSSGRPILLSLSPGPTSPALAKELLPFAQMWRISDDIWDDWAKPKGVMRGVRDQFALAAAWAPFAGPGAWPDADMLPLGYLGPVPGEGMPRDSLLSHDEQVSLMTLWAIARSPLILGANLTKLDAWTTSLITNPDVLFINQFGSNQRQVAREGNTVAWTTEGKGAVRYLALFNLNDREKSITRSFDFYNLPLKTYRTHDVWSNTDRGTSKSINLVLPAHACVLLKLEP